MTILALTGADKDAAERCPPVHMYSVPLVRDATQGAIKSLSPLTLLIVLSNVYAVMIQATKNL